MKWHKKNFSFVVELISIKDIFQQILLDFFHLVEQINTITTQTLKHINIMGESLVWLPRTRERKKGGKKEGEEEEEEEEISVVQF